MSVKEVAKIAGVSPMTVSRVVNARPHVSTETSRLVHEAIEKVGYKPRFRHDRRRKRAEADGVSHSEKLGVFALVVPGNHGWYPSLQSSFVNAVSKFGRQVIVCYSGNDAAKQADIFFRLMDKNVAGVAVVPTTAGPSPAYQVRQLQASGVPVVLLHHAMNSVEAPTLVIPYNKIGHRAAGELLARGHRRMACFFSDSNDQVQMAESGFRQAVEAAGCELPADMVVYGQAHHAPLEVHEQVCEAALRNLLSRPAYRRPTAIWVSYDTQAELIYLLLNKLNVSVPQQMSLLSFGAGWRNGPLAARISAVTVDEKKTGERAASMLHEINEGKPIHSNNKLPIPLSLHEGQTLARCSDNEIREEHLPHRNV